MTEQIALRHYRLFSRSPCIEVDGQQLAIRVPSVFGRRVRWRVPISEVAVLDSAAGADNDESGEGWVFQRVLLVPYLATTTTSVSANLTLYFRTPQRIPAVSVLGLFGQPAPPFRTSRSADGYRVDGARFRAVDPAQAVSTLIAAGAERIDRPVAWLHSHFPTTTNPEAVEVEAMNARRWRWVLPLIVLGTVGLIALRFLAHDLPFEWFVIALAAVLLVTWGVPLWASWRLRRERARL